MLPGAGMESSERRRTARLIDELIDGAHRRCPDHPFRLLLPTGEVMNIPPHDPLLRCATLGHAGYFLTQVAPSLGAWPVPTPAPAHADLRCWMSPMPEWTVSTTADGARKPVPQPHSCTPLWADLAPDRPRRSAGLPWSRLTRD